MSLQYPKHYNAERMEALIQATNKVNALANELQPILLARFSPFVGCKILKADGQLMKKLSDLIPSYKAFEDNYACDCLYAPQSDYTLRIFARCRSLGCAVSE